LLQDKSFPFRRLKNSNLVSFPPENLHDLENSVFPIEKKFARLFVCFEAYGTAGGLLPPFLVRFYGS